MTVKELCNWTKSEYDLGGEMSLESFKQDMSSIWPEYPDKGIDDFTGSKTVLYGDGWITEVYLNGSFLMLCHPETFLLILGWFNKT